jgi:hypothetical protein
MEMKMFKTGLTAGRAPLNSKPANDDEDQADIYPFQHSEMTAEGLCSSSIRGRLLFLHKATKLVCALLTMLLLALANERLRPLSEGTNYFQAAGLKQTGTAQRDAEALLQSQLDDPALGGQGSRNMAKSQVEHNRPRCAKMSLDADHQLVAFLCSATAAAASPDAETLQVLLKGRRISIFEAPKQRRFAVWLRHCLPPLASAETADTCPPYRDANSRQLPASVQRLALHARCLSVLQFSRQTMLCRQTEGWHLILAGYPISAVSSRILHDFVTSRSNSHQS